MANLNDVKVGDRVWVGKCNYRGTDMDRHDGIITVTRVTPKQFHGALGFQHWYKESGKPIGYGSLWALSIATPEEVEKWEAEQAQKKQAVEAAEAERRRVYQERCDRADRLATVLEECSDGHRFILQPEEGTITLWYCGHRYSISEVTDND